MHASIVFLLIIVTVAAFLQASTGYGFSIIGTPFLLLLYPAHAAIQINIILSICLSAFMIVSIRKEIETVLLKRLMKGSAAGLVIGILVYLYADIRMLKMIVGLLIVSVTILLLMKYTIARSHKRDLAMGGISGMLTTSIGVPGPPLLLYFHGGGLDRIKLRSTTLSYYLFVYAVSLLAQITFSGTNKETWTASLIALPALMAGAFLGQLSIKRISPGVFRIITYSILLATGIYLTVSAIRQL